MTRKQPRRGRRRARFAGWGAIAVALVYALLQAGLEDGLSVPGVSDVSSGGPAATTAPGESTRRGSVIAALHAERRSGEVVESSGRVVKVLRDDLDGSRHQKFLLEVADAGGLTILVSHNIDLAPRVVNLARGDTVTFRGQYESNEKGGVVHWTHHDPKGRRPGGWLRHEGQTYR